MQMTGHTFITWDGTELFYRAWLPNQPATKAILLFHRGHEHSGRWQQTVDDLDLSDFAIFAWDQRGHGRSPGKRGHAPTLAAIIKDADRFARHIRETHAIATENMAVLASSVGAVIAAAWVHDYAPQIRAMVLAAPAFSVNLYVPLAIPFLRFKEKIAPGGNVKSYVRSSMLTHDRDQAAAYDADPLIFRQIAINILLDLHDAGKRIVTDAAAIRCPTLILSADRDWVVKFRPQQNFFKQLGSPYKQMDILPDSYHSLFHESNRAVVVARTRAFIEEAFNHPCQSDGLLDADKGGITRTEYDLLRGPGSSKWGIVRANLKTFGRLSNGIRLGWNSGFDSGRSLDYVYENKSRGITPLGKIIDYFYLNSVGWRGIRIRRQSLQRMLQNVIQQLHQEGRPVRILDIASGPGRYVLETMRDLRDVPISATLRDYQQQNLDAARKLADELQLTNVTITQGDAFDRASLAGTAPRPTIAIVSGLYELFPENAPLRDSLAGIADAMDPGGFLIYTCQPWHPQLEFIGRVLTNREGRPWVMRRRMQAEMDALVRAAGFEKIDQEIDPWGIFTVSLARRVPQ